MNKTICILLPVFVVLLLSGIPSTNAHYLLIRNTASIYQPGDTINITANVSNTKNEAVNLILEANLQDIRGKITPYSISYPLILTSGENKTVQLFLLPVDESFYSGQYVVHASVIEGRFRVCEEDSYFQVEGALDDMEVSILLSNDSTFPSQTHTFIRGETIYLDLHSSANDCVVTASLLFPDNSSRSVIFPMSITAEQDGIYTLLVNASAKGYRNTSGIEYFAVLSHEPFSAEQPEEKTAGETGRFPLEIILITVIALIIITVIVSMYKKKYF